MPLKLWNDKIVSVTRVEKSPSSALHLTSMYVHLFRYFLSHQMRTPNLAQRQYVVFAMCFSLDNRSALMS